MRIASERVKRQCLRVFGRGRYSSRAVRHAHRIGKGNMLCEMEGEGRWWWAPKKVKRRPNRFSHRKAAHLLDHQNQLEGMGW